MAGSDQPGKKIDYTRVPRPQQAPTGPAPTGPAFAAGAPGAPDGVPTAGGVPAAGGAVPQPYPGSGPGVPGSGGFPAQGGPVAGGPAPAPGGPGAPGGPAGPGGGRPPRRRGVAYTTYAITVAVAIMAILVVIFVVKNDARVNIWLFGATQQMSVAGALAASAGAGLLIGVLLGLIPQIRLRRELRQLRRAVRDR